MNKRRLHHSWTRLRHVRPWYFLVIALVSAVVCVFALRANNQHMLQLRDAVYRADQNDGDVQGALEKLRIYVTTHMNTNLSTGTSVYPPIQLKYTYDRLAKQQADKLAAGNGQLYTEAQHYCEQQHPTGFSGRVRVPCIEAYVEAHAGGQLPMIPADLYKFSFESPAWSPDLAGWSLAVSGAGLILFVITKAAELWFRRQVA